MAFAALELTSNSESDSEFDSISDAVAEHGVPRIADALRTRRAWKAMVRRSREISMLALRALHDELCLYPKPGLVSRIDNGSHDDMDAATFMRSLFSLRRYFSTIYLAGATGVSFNRLQKLGIDAEKRMLRATAGVNTHRGAIFNLGILCAAAGRWEQEGGASNLSATVVCQWSDDIKHMDSVADDASHGSRACRRYAVGGARGEAAMGFPHVFDVGLPALRAARAAGASERAARAQAFFAILAVLDDTNLLHRGHASGLAYAHRAAREFLAAGGVLRENWPVRARAIHDAFVRRRLSPGGSADLLAATLLVDRILSGDGWQRWR